MNNLTTQPPRRMGMNPIAIESAQMPAALRQRQAQGVTTNSNFAEGVADSFPVLSIKGKTFRQRVNREEKPFLMHGMAVPFLDVVLVNASRTLSKSYYDKGFTDGDMEPPLCWSMDAIKPDASVVNKVSPTCIGCPMNVIGSRVGDGGKPMKACSDARRIAVIVAEHLDTQDQRTLMLRVPQSSLKNLREYANVLDRQGWEPAACVTRLSFDPTVAYPKLQFHFIDALNDDEYMRVVEVAESAETAAMLKAPDFDAGPSSVQPSDPNPQLSPRVRQSGVTVGDAAPVPERSLSQPVQAAPMPAPTPAPAPVQAPPVQAAPLAEVPSNVIELPDGKLYDTITGKYVERPAPAVQMPQLDPATLALPDGKFFNQLTRQFVTGPEVGAKPVTEVQEPPKRASKGKAARGRAAAVATPPAEAAPVTEEEDEAEEPHTNGAVQPVVTAAPEGLDDLLAAVMPTKKN